MKTLTKLFTATALTIGLLVNSAQANYEICEKNSNMITLTYTTTAELVGYGVRDKSGTIDFLRTAFKKELKSQFRGGQLQIEELQIGLLMGNHAFDYVDENYEKMQSMTNAEIKRIGYDTCGDIESLVKTYLILHLTK